MASKAIVTNTKIVTPEMCLNWLETNEENRPIRNNHIKTLARTMAKGHWKFNGESLKLDTKGNVLDGQHRMWACIESQTPFKTLVVSNIPRSTFDTIDTGESRSASDVFAINKEHNVHVTVAALKHVGNYYMGTMLGRTKFTNRELEELLEQHPEVRDYASKVVGQTNIRWCAGSVLVVCWYLASRKHNAQSDEFFMSLINGTDLTADSVILTIRNKFIDVQASSVQKMGSTQKINLIILAWNMWRKNKTVKHFKTSSLAVTSDSFPTFK